jgi:hypothetical protein
MFTLKRLPREAIERALEKAKRYRMLNEPFEAESICQDVLAIDAENQEALIMLLLALTDKFKHELNPAFSQALEVLARLSDHYCKAYYEGIIYERRAKVHLSRQAPGSGFSAYEWFRKAMDAYEKAQMCAPQPDDAILRWNTCARIVMQHPDVVPAPEDAREQMLE